MSPIAATSAAADLAQAGLDRLALVAGELLRGQPAASGDAEEVARRWSSLEVADQDRVDLILLPRALPDELCATSDPPAQNPGRFVDRPCLRDQPSGEQPDERAGIGFVGLRTCLRQALDRFRIGEHDSRDVGLEDPRDRKRVSGRLEHHLVVTSKTLGEELELARLCPHTAREPDCAATLGDRDLAEVAVDVECDVTHPSSSRSGRRKTRRATRQLRIRARGTPGQSQGRPTTNRGLAAHRNAPACPTCVLPEAPVPE
jgi:hypothetical protein